MASVSRKWDLFVANSILTGWCCSKINPFNSSLLFAWMIFLCDLVYSIDVLARTVKQAGRISEVFVNVPWAPVLQFSTKMSLVFVSCVPYHMLVVLELDISGVYLLMCTLRVARLLKCGRINLHFASVYGAVRKKVRQAFRKPAKAA